MLGPSTAYDRKTNVIIRKAKPSASKIIPASDRNSLNPERNLLGLYSGCLSDFFSGSSKCIGSATF